MSQVEEKDVMSPEDQRKLKQLKVTYPVQQLGGGVENFGYFGMFSPFSQLVLCFLMVAGRLEMYAIVILFTKSFWKHNKANAI